MKERLKSVKEYLAKFSKKTLITAAIIAAVVILGAVIIALVLNHKEYETLYTNLTTEETTEILGKLGELGVSYTSSGNGQIKVPSDQVDTVRAQLAQEGYPKSGFAYDVFINNAGGMTTDMEKQTYKIYDLQERIGSTIRLFNGVKDAKVTIALQEKSRYVLDDTADNAGNTASVMVVMEDGVSLTNKMALGMQRLVARSIPGMEMENVAIVDEDGLDLTDTSDSISTSDLTQEVARVIETQIAKKVVNVLEPFYGEDNVRVSVRGKVNMEKLIRESITYTTPEKIDEEDKTGILSHLESSAQGYGDGDGAAGLVGTETNSETTQYVADAGDGAEGYWSNSQVRDYLVNSVKEQGEIPPGALEDVTVSVSINGETLGGLDEDTVIDLVGNAAGIEMEDRDDKITVANAPFYVSDDSPDVTPTETFTVFVRNNLPFLLIGLAAVLALLILVIILRRRAKKRKEEEAKFLEEARLAEEAAAAAAAREAAMEMEPVVDTEMINMQNERSRELRETVRQFTEENPELSAQMIKNWLHGGDEGGD